MTNTLAYYGKTLITTEKCFIVQANYGNIINIFFLITVAASNYTEAIVSEQEFFSLAYYFASMARAYPTGAPYADPIQSLLAINRQD